MASVGDGGGETVELNIMPMLDIFSILILFLLMSFSTDPVNHDITAGLEMPDSITLRSLDEIPKVTMTKNELLFQDKIIAKIDLKTRDFFSNYTTQGAIKPLFDELEKMAAANKKRKKLSINNADEKPQTDALTLEMDKGHEYIVLRRIMLSAQQAEFISFKLMVAKESE